MPLFTWLRSSASTGSSPTAAASAARRQLYSQTQTATATAYTAIQTASSTLWLTNTIGSTTVTTSAISQPVWLLQERGWFEEEASVDHWQYVALAQQRVALAEQQQVLAEAQARAFQAATLQRIEEQRRLEQQTAADREAALARSRMLLLSHLTPAQRRTFLDNKWFIVQGGATKTRYRVRTDSYTGNIDILAEDGSRATHHLCGHLRPHVPLYDHHIAQKISLEYDEETFVRLCNRSAA